MTTTNTYWSSDHLKGVREYTKESKLENEHCVQDLLGHVRIFFDGSTDEYSDDGIDFGGFNYVFFYMVEVIASAAFSHYKRGMKKKEITEWLIETATLAINEGTKVKRGTR